MLFSRAAALLLPLFSSSLPGRRPWATADGGNAGAGRPGGVGPREVGETDPQGGIRSGEGRRLQQTLTASATNSTAGAALLPDGLRFCTDEFGFQNCNIACPSKFYTVAGTGNNMTASTCGGADWDTLLYVRAGSTNSSCSELTCAGRCLIKPRLRFTPTSCLMLAARFRCRQQRPMIMIKCAIPNQVSPGGRKPASHTTSRLLDSHQAILDPTPSKLLGSGQARPLLRWSPQVRNEPMDGGSST
jgi:hypothetical protein